MAGNVETPKGVDNISQLTLTESERQNWVRYKKNELKNQVLDGLKVNSLGSDKFVKDVLHYNSDILSIKDKPEKVIMLQLFLKGKIDKRVIVTGVYDEKTQQAIDSYRKQASSEGEMANFQQKYPAFNSLVQKFPERFEEFKKRALLYKELENLKGEINFNQYFEKENIVKIQQLLAIEPDNATFNKNFVTTKIEGWNDVSSINYNLIGSEIISYSEYIKRLTSKVGLVSELFSGVDTKQKKEVKEKTQLEKEQLGRVKVFMDSVISINPRLNMVNRKDVESIYKTISLGNIVQSTNLINRLTEKELRMTVNLGTQEGLAKALRTIGDTTTAGKVLHGEIVSDLGKTENAEGDVGKRNNYKSKYAENLGRIEKNQQYKGLLEKRYNEILISIADDPTSEYYYIVNNDSAKQQLKEGVISIIAFDETMKELGPDGLGELGKVYNDMKGLNGWNNFSDENKKMTKEMGIMLASMALTAGAGLFLLGAGAIARSVQAGRMVKLADTANKTGVVAKTGKTIHTVFKGVAQVSEKAFLISAKGVEALNKIPIIGNAAIFTAIDSGIKFGFKSEGELIANLNDFSRSLATNTAMFGMFHGFGKVSEGIIKKFGIENAFAKFGTLASGDVAGMYVLNLIETGNYTPTEEEWAKIASQAVGFRGAMKGIEKAYPKLTAKINAMNEKNNVKINNAKKTIDNNTLKSQGINPETDGIVLSNGVRTSTGVADKTTLDKNGKLFNEERIKESERLLGRELNKKEIVALMKAHEVNNNFSEKTEKVLANAKKLLILRKSGISENETLILMDKGIAGKNVSVGDLHGELVAFEGNMIEAGLINESGKWIGGNSKIVFHGDIIGDRGTTSIETLQKIADLKMQAKKGGGDIQYLLGNHDSFAFEFLGEYGVKGHMSGIDINPTKWRDIDEYGWQFQNQAKGLLEYQVRFGNLKSTDVSFDNLQSGGKLLENMKNTEEGKKILEAMCDYDIYVYRDGTLYTHTPITESMADYMVKNGVEESVKTINSKFKASARLLLLGETTASAEVNGLTLEQAKTFLQSIGENISNTGNRMESINPTAEIFTKLKEAGVNRIIHGHEGFGGNHGPIETISVDKGYGKRGSINGEKSLFIGDEIPKSKADTSVTEAIDLQEINNNRTGEIPSVTGKNLDQSGEGKVRNSDGVDDVKTGKNTNSVNQTVKKNINKTTGVSKKGKINESDLLTDNEIGLIELDKEIQDIEKQRNFIVKPELDGLSRIKNSDSTILKMNEGRILELQKNKIAVVREQKINKLAVAREQKVTEVRRLISENFISNTGKIVGEGENITIQVSEREFLISKENGKYRLVEKNNFITNGTIEYEPGFSTATDLIKHIEGIVRNEYNSKLEELGVKNPEKLIGNSTNITSQTNQQSIGEVPAVVRRSGEPLGEGKVGDRDGNIEKTTSEQGNTPLLTYNPDVRSLSLNEKGQKGDIIKNNDGTFIRSDKQKGWIKSGTGEIIKTENKDFEKIITDDYGNEVVVKTLKNPKIVTYKFGNEIETKNVIKLPETIKPSEAIKLSETINTQVTLETPEQAKTWLKTNWKKLALGAGALALVIGGTTYLATRNEENGEVGLREVSENDDNNSVSNPQIQGESGSEKGKTGDATKSKDITLDRNLPQSQQNQGTDNQQTTLPETSKVNLLPWVKNHLSNEQIDVNTFDLVSAKTVLNKFSKIEKLFIKGSDKSKFPENSAALIYAVQFVLNKKNNAGLVLDGLYGNYTMNAISNFQIDNKLTSDGIPGNNTLTKILELVDKK